MADKALETAKSGIAVIGAIVALTLWAARLEFTSGTHVTREEVQAEQYRTERVLERLDARTARTEALLLKVLCREFPNDSSCE